MATKRQRDTFNIHMEKHGKSLSGAMKEAGYSDNYAKNPQELEQKKGWQELLDEKFPDGWITDILVEAATAERVISAMTGTPANGKTVDFIDVPDWATRMDATKTILKIKDKFPATKSATDITTKGEKIVQPILGGTSAVHSDDSHEESAKPNQTD